MKQPQIYLSSLDESRFGVRTVQARDLKRAQLDELEAFSQKNQAELVIARVNVQDLELVQKMEGSGFRLMDTLVYYVYKFAKNTLSEETQKHEIRAIRPEDLDQIVAIATESFKGYYGHYHADPRLPQDKCDEIYTDWAAQSVLSKEFAQEVLVVEGEVRLDGFATLRMNHPTEGEGVLFAVAPHAQGQGIYQSMMKAGIKWVESQGAEQMVVSTQITNVAVQKVWARLGFEMYKAYYTLHKWY